MIILGLTLLDQALEPQSHEGKGKMKARHPRY